MINEHLPAVLNKFITKVQTIAADCRRQIRLAATSLLQTLKTSDRHLFASPYLMRRGAATLGLLVLCLSSLAAWQLASPTVAPALFPFTETFYARSIAARAPEAQVRWAIKAVEVAPRRAENWTLLAYAYYHADGHLSARTIQALRNSYLVGPLAPDTHNGRLTLIFSTWRQSPLPLRRLAIREASAYASRYAGSVALDNLRSHLTDPDARFVIYSILLAR